MASNLAWVTVPYLGGIHPTPLRGLHLFLSFIFFVLRQQASLHWFAEDATEACSQEIKCKFIFPLLKGGYGRQEEGQGNEVQFHGLSGKENHVEQLNKWYRQCSYSGIPYCSRICPICTCIILRYWALFPRKSVQSVNSTQTRLWINICWLRG